MPKNMRMFYKNMRIYAHVLQKGAHVLRKNMCYNYYIMWNVKATSITNVYNISLFKKHAHAYT